MLDTQFYNNFWQRMEATKATNLHLVMIATKPDIIKQAPIYQELKKRGECVLLGHTGQHYDYNLSGGMLDEFGLQVDFNLGIDGPYHHKVAQIIERLGDILAKLKSMGKTVIPYVHGDTMTAMAASNAAWANEFGCVHVEAGIRTLTPKKELLQALLDGMSFEDWRTTLLDRNNWERGSIEPYPEQFNTRCAAPAAGLHCIPHELYFETMKGEGFYEDRIVLTGNSVVDATDAALEEAKNSDIFDRFPQLANGFIRFCIHRQENCRSEKRFVAIFEAMEMLAKQGETILLISLNATEGAIDRFGLRDRMNELSKLPNFVYSPVWPLYRDVIAAMMKSTVCATDSGSMQEEMNHIGIPTVTLRYGSDRSESAMAGGNVIAPPSDAKTIARLILGAKECEAMRNAPKIYGSNVSAKIADAVLSLLNKNEKMFRYEHERLGF